MKQLKAYDATTMKNYDNNGKDRYFRCDYDNDDELQIHPIELCSY